MPPRLRRSVLHRAAGVAELRLPAPRIDQTAAQALCAAVDEIALDETLRVVIVRGAPGAFCLGVTDLGAWATQHDWVAAVGNLALPVIAAIDGDALAEGCELALACDLRLASPRARFALPQLVDGRLPRHGGTQRLPRLIGRSRALELLLSGRVVAAREAERLGLVSRLAPAGRLNTVVRREVASLCAKGPIALRLGKEAVGKGVDLTLEQGIRLEQDLYVLLQTTGDRAEGVRSFLQKRPPRFQGR